ncbi:MAG: RNA polymerase sigma-70 factor (ECF subfamily) [Phycisphaerales bacterium]|jgi:RNA polymerase sigma-70 factor (ECF subfamily)
MAPSHNATTKPERQDPPGSGGLGGRGLGTGAGTVIGGLGDEELARRSADGDRACFSELVSRYDERVFGLVLSRVRVRADAEEAAQETFLRAWRGIKTFDPERRFAAWIMTIAHRQAIDVIRRRTRDRERLAEGRLGEGPVPIREETPSVWTAARRELKPDAYEALWLRYAEDCSPQEVARVMGKTGVWVRVTLHRSRARLAQVLGEHDPAAAEQERPNESGSEQELGRASEESSEGERA